MEKAQAIVMAASVEVARAVRDILASKGGVAWTIGRFIASKLPAGQVRSLVPGRFAGEVKVFDGPIPEDQLAEAPAGVRALLAADGARAHSTKPPPHYGQSWDAPGLLPPDGPLTNKG